MRRVPPANFRSGRRSSGSAPNRPTSIPRRPRPPTIRRPSPAIPPSRRGRPRPNFRHGMLCKIRATGGCILCKRMWYLLQLHARACKESGCLVPRCKDLKEHMRRLQQQSDSRRRAAVMEMMRQRVAGNSG